MRVYLPATLPILAGWVERRAAGQEELLGHAVTPALRAAAEATAVDEEDLEYLAYQGATVDSLRLLAVDGAAPRCRVVVAAEVPEAMVTVTSDGAPDTDPAQEWDDSSVTIATTVPLDAWAAIHADERSAARIVREAADHIGAADMGDPAAAAASDAVLDTPLLWWTVAEGTALVDGSAPTPS